MERGSALATKEIVKLSELISLKEMQEVATVAHAAGGKLVAVEGEDDRCGNGRIRFPWPPKRQEFQKFIDVLVDHRINFETLINGIPVPDEIMIRVRRGLVH